MSSTAEPYAPVVENIPGQVNGADKAMDSNANISTEAAPDLKKDPGAQEHEQRQAVSGKSEKVPAKETESTPATKHPRSRRPSNSGRPIDNSTPTVGTRRQANGTIGSVYSGNKIRHLKKEDGVPLWRKDIQFKFLKMVFEDKTPVFTRFPDGQKGLTFADIYIDAMAKSSKTSKILKEKLTTERPSATQMAMVCLLVNMGRMNTTLNFFPEMRAQLRTYHPIPSLQAHNDESSAYKQLQDAPRLKSILKGASEDVDQPGTIDKIKAAAIPRSNPVNLIFVLSQYAPKISELHFPPPRDFFDLVMGASLSSRSRARAFLWLMWYYLESDFSEEAALANPFGPGLVGEGTDGMPFKVPQLEVLTEEEADAENVDTPEEIQFGKEKQEERKRILLDDDVLFRYSKRQKKGAQEYVSDHSEDTPGRSSLAARRVKDEPPTTMFTPLNPPSKRGADDDEGVLTPTHPARSRAKRAKRDSGINQSGGQRLVLKTRMEQTPDTSTPAPPGFAHPVLHQFNGSPATPGSHGRRPRPMTQHQLALEQNRKERVEYMLAERRASSYQTFRARRERAEPFFRAGRLLQGLPDGYDTDEETSWGKGGLCPNPKEEDDYGESANHFLSVLRKAARRLQRWDWDSIATREPETWVNQIGRGRRHRSEPWAAVHEPEAIAEPTPPLAKRGRGGRRKAVETASNTYTPTTGRRGGRGGAGGRKRGSGEGSGRRGRGGRVSKIKLEESAVPDQSSAPSSRAASPTITHPDEDYDKTTLPDESIMDQDEIDKEGVGDEETVIPPSDNAGVETSASALAPEEHYHDEDDASSACHGAPVEASHADDTDPMSEMGLSSAAAGNELQSPWSDDETDTAPEDGDGDETMVDA